MVTKSEDLIRWVRQIEVMLPNIRPLKHFLHLNMYPDLLPMGYWEALEKSAEFFDTHPFPERRYYLELFDKGEIDQEFLNLKAREHGLTFDDLFAPEMVWPQKEKGYRPLHQLLSEAIGQSLNDLVEPQLNRFCSHFFDQGISDWSMPSRHLSLLQAFLELNTQAYFPVFPFTQSLAREFQDKAPAEVCTVILSRLFADGTCHEAYTRECLVALKGWAGMIKSVHRTPELLHRKRTADLTELLALRLLLEYAWLMRMSPQKIPLAASKTIALPVRESPLVRKKRFLTYRCWQEAHEQTIASKKLQSLATFMTQATHKAPAKYQAIFCIDDRECSLRRNLESSLENIDTFGSPGHFGLDFNFAQAPGELPVKSCPAPIPAPFLLRQLANPQSEKKYTWLGSLYKNIASEFLLSFTDGVQSGVDLIRHNLLPSRKLQTSPLTIAPAPRVDVFAPDGGYDPKSASDRIASVLRSIGLVNNFAPIILTLGHGATTTNNPYFMAYGCGACSGRRGDINAFAFAQLANTPAVREHLARLHQIDLPESTVFVSGWHDTCAETLTLHAQPNFPLEKQSELLKGLEAALVKNARERIADLRPKDQPIDSDAQALRLLQQRAHAIFEPRPELGHTNNSFCVIAPRAQMRTFSFERKAFLQSYAPATDPDGKLLESILMATVPVCGGISLDYLFSRQNNSHIGAGSKLSHNVTALIGVTHGTEDDLQTGLPIQMVERHTPVRIHFFIQQHPSVLSQILERNTLLANWVNGGWVLLKLIAPETREVLA